MGFLSSILPGLRDLRTPLLVGYTYLLAIWIGASQSVVDGAEWDRVGVIFQPLQDTFGAAFTVAAVSVVAYLLGVLTSTDAQSRSKAADLIFYYSPWRVTPRKSGPGLTRLGKMVVALGVTRFDAWRLARHELGADLAEPLRPGFTDKDGNPEALNNQEYLDSVESTFERFDEGALSSRLQIANGDVWNRYDQLVTEAHFRASMAPATVAVALTLAYRVSPLLALGVLAAVGLRYSGMSRLKAARGVLVQALSTGLIADPAFAGAEQRVVEELETVISELEGQSGRLDDRFTTLQGDVQRYTARGDLDQAESVRHEVEAVSNERADIASKLADLRRQLLEVKR